MCRPDVPEVKASRGDEKEHLEQGGKGGRRGGGGVGEERKVVEAATNRRQQRALREEPQTRLRRGQIRFLSTGQNLPVS